MRGVGRVGVIRGWGDVQEGPPEAAGQAAKAGTFISLRQSMTCHLSSIKLPSCQRTRTVSDSRQQGVKRAGPGEVSPVLRAPGLGAKQLGWQDLIWGSSGKLLP
jgi:hypothetical protein